MRASDLIGRKIVAVEQTRIKPPSGRTFYHIDRITLDNGKTLTFSVVELGGEYGIEPYLWKPEKGAGK